MRIFLVLISFLFLACATTVEKTDQKPQTQSAPEWIQKADSPAWVENGYVWAVGRYPVGEAGVNFAIGHADARARSKIARHLQPNANFMYLTGVASANRHLEQGEHPIVYSMMKKEIE